MISLRLSSTKDESASEQFDVSARDDCVRLADIQRATGRNLKKLRAAGQEQVALSELRHVDSNFNKYLRRCWHCHLLVTPARHEPAVPATATLSPGLLALEQGKEMISRMLERRRAIESESETERLLLGALLRATTFLNEQRPA